MVLEDPWVKLHSDKIKPGVTLRVYKGVRACPFLVNGVSGEISRKSEVIC